MSLLSPVMSIQIESTLTRRSILISEDPSIAGLIDNALHKSPYAVSHQAATLAQVAAAEVLDKPVMLIIATQKLDENLLTLVSTLLKQQSMPVVIFTGEYDALLQQQAIQAGVSAFVVDGLQPHRVLPVVSMAQSRFNHQQQLQQQVQELETKLAERKVIDRAKGLLMQQRQCSEDEAYKMLRTAAMNKNMRLAMLAQQVLSTASLMESAR